MKKNYNILIMLAATLLLAVASCGEDEETAGYTPEVIENPVTGISIANVTADGIVLPDVGATETVQVSATPANAGDADRYHYTYTSGDQRVFTVSDAGVVTATGVGEAWLTVIPKNNAALTAKCKVTVVGVRVTAIDIAPAYQTRTMTRTNAAGPSFEMSAQITVQPANASVKRVTYSSSNPEVATVSEDGTVTAIWAGTTTIRVAAIDGSGVTADAEITVAITPITSLSFYGNTFNALNLNTKMNQAGNYDLHIDYSKGTATSSPIRYQPTTATRNTLEYASSDEEVLGIESTSSNGFRLTPKKAGRATITATATDGSGVTVTSNTISVYPILPRTGWEIVESSPTGEVQDGGDTWGGPIGNFFVDGKQVGFFRLGTPEHPTGSGDPYFVIDFKQNLTFNYLIYSHSWSGNWNNFSRANRETLYGSNDGTTFEQIGSQLSLNPAYNAFYAFPQVQNYRYLKVVLATNSAAYTGTGSGTYTWARAKLFIIYDFNLGYLPPL
jgi:uncharacterized protein YjdB